MNGQTLHKNERLSKQILIDKLFSGKAISIPVFPLRAVYLEIEDDCPPLSLLISVPKKRFKRAVKRNRVKRQIREAFRKNKEILTKPLADSEKKLLLGIIWLDQKLYDSEIIEIRVVHLLNMIRERL